MNSTQDFRTLTDNPFDPRKQKDLPENARRFLHFTRDCLHGDDESLIDRYVAEEYIQHTHGVGQGREGIRRYLHEIAWKRPGRRNFIPLHLFSDGDFVILHKLLPSVMIVDILRCNADHLFLEHWDVVQPLPEPDHDPLIPSTENLARFRELFGIKG